MSGDTDLQKLLELLSEIQGKLKAPALNGGFDTLMYKVDKIEECQEKILDRISVLNDAIYDPDKGLFARVKIAESSKDEEILELEKDIRDRNLKNEVHIKELESSVDSLLKWKNNVVSSFKWLAITLATAGVGVLATAIRESFMK